ncbi:hypothetical protein SAMN06298214_0705 [Bacteroidales bacterium WCE2004]|nr:hypothetical protein SAMN06298214_0705 [Bacteroidales bacterium WCE2004]
MNTFMIILAVILGILGIIGSIMPGLPGPPLSWIGILLMYFFGGTNGQGEPLSQTLLFVLLAVTIVVTVLDYVVPAWFTKITGGSKYASWGAVIGLFAGLILPLPGGMIVTSLVGAFLAELLLAGKDVGPSLKASLGAFLGFLSGTGMKLVVSAAMLYYIIVYI